MDKPIRSKDSQKIFFDAVHERALMAQERREPIVHILNVAGDRLRLVFAGDQLEQLFMPALAHLIVVDDGPVDAVFNIWDSKSTGIQIVRPPCESECFTDRGDIWGFGGDFYRVAFHGVECSVSVFDRETRVGVWWVNSAASLPYWTTASPMRSLFHWWMELNGKQLLHAAAIGTDHGAVVVTGKGGVGKSTTALAALAQGANISATTISLPKLAPSRAFTVSIAPRS